MAERSSSAIVENWEWGGKLGEDAIAASVGSRLLFLAPASSPLQGQKADRVACLCSRQLLEELDPVMVKHSLYLDAKLFDLQSDARQLAICGWLVSDSLPGAPDSWDHYALGSTSLDEWYALLQKT